MWPNPGLGLSWAVRTAQYGGLDIMVANAGIVKGADFLDMTEEDFDAVINVNLKGVFLVRPLTCLCLIRVFCCAFKSGFTPWY